MKTSTLFYFFLILISSLSAQNNSLNFDGIDDVVIGTSDPKLEITNGTVELWIKPELKSSSQTFLCYRNNTGSQTRYLWNFLGNLSGLGFWNGSFYHTFSYSFNAGQWYHLAFVGDVTQTKIFINGSQVGVFVIPFGTATGSSLKLVLGNDIPGPEYFKGDIDEVRIWDRALCSEEINNYMNCEVAVNATDLITYYDFNQGIAGGNNSSENTLYDLTTTGVNGTLTNFSLNGTLSNWVNSTTGVSGNCSPTSCPPPHLVQTYYLISSDYSFVQSEYNEIIRSMKEIQGWYQTQTGGKTFHLYNSENPIIVNLPNTSSYYNVDYWGRIQTDMSSLGYTPFNSGRINVYFIKGGGGVALGAQACGVECGLAMFGMDIYPQFNTGQFFTCPNAPGGAAAWPCTPLGAATHELGHCFGLPHPIDVPSTAGVANHSVMQTHWNYPYSYAPQNESPWGLLTIERQTLLINPFFFDDIQLTQINEDLPIVNLPSTGISPIANFTYTINDKTVSFNNSSSNNMSDYWTFGNEDISHDNSPIYTFSEYGVYTVRLRVLNSNGMMDIQEETIDLTSSLPMDLIYFDVTESRGKAEITWLTENEVNVSEYEIFKSENGQDWYSVGIHTARNETRNNYVFYDDLGRYQQELYYKLKMIDLDESFSWSAIRVIRQKDKSTLKIFPNPNYSNSILYMTGIETGEISKVSILKSTGGLVKNYPIQSFSESDIGINLSLPELTNGVYLLKIEMERNRYHFKKLIILN